jgi:hypothetical protein
MSKLHGHKENTAAVLLVLYVLREMPSIGFTCIVDTRLSERIFMAQLPSYTRYNIIVV